MAKKAKKDNKNMIIGGICAAVVVVVIIIVAVVLATRGSGLNDGYFVSDDTKYVLTIENDSITEEGSDAYEPVKTHIVYTYSGDEITGMKTYGEFADADSAKAAFDAIKESGEDMTNYALDGKFIVITATADQYEGMTASDVKSQIEFMESLKNMDLDEIDAGEEEEVVVEEEPAVEEEE